MNTKEQIAEALHINVINEIDPESRLIICVKKNITKDNGEVVELDVGHFGLICAHSTGIAFNAWDGYTKVMNWYPEYPNLVFTDKFTKNDFFCNVEASDFPSYQCLNICLFIAVYVTL